MFCFNGQKITFEYCLMDKVINNRIIFHIFAEYKCSFYHFRADLIKLVFVFHKYVQFRGHIFSCVQPIYERAVSNLDRCMRRSLWV